MSGGHVDSRALGQRKEDDGHDGGRLSPPQSQPPSTTWYEQIQFKAQYYHFRTNNYANIVKSANSLDKVTHAIPLVTVTAPPSSITKRSTVAHDQRQHEEGKRKFTSHDSSSGVQSACWNFPRLKFRHIFNTTKSLDDILGRSNEDRGSRASPVDKEDCLIRRSLLNTSPSQLLRPPKARRPRSSSTESNVHYPSPHTPTPTAPVVISPITHSKSATDVQIEHRAFRYHFPTVPQVASLSSSSSDTNCFSPPVHFSSNKSIPPQVFSHNQSKSISLPPLPPTSRILSIPQIRLPPLSKNMKQGTPTSTSHFLKNKVEPSPASVEGRKLVVATVSYLQRPSSPSPVTPGGSPASSQPPTPHGLSPSVTSVFTPSLTPRESPLPPPPPRLLKSTRFFSSCCNSGNDVILSQVLNNEKKFQSRTREKVPISILKNKTVHLGHGDQEKNRATTCSKVPRQGSRTKNESLEDVRKETKEIGTISPTTIQSRPRPAACGEEAQETPNQEPREKSEEEEDRMADLQSPHYVKRTAHMFNSKYISSAQNGSHSTDGVSASCSPSYLNVSRSVSGYSCLSYNSTSPATNGHNQSVDNDSHTSRTPFRTSRSLLRHYSSFPAKSPGRDSPGRLYSDSSPPPPPLPKSAPPLASPALVGQSTQRLNQNGRSLIMEKIERLYGQSGELESATSVWRRRTPPPPVVSPIERIIPISVEQKSEKGFRNSPSSNGLHGKAYSFTTVEQSEAELRNYDDDVCEKSMEKQSYLDARDKIISQSITKEQPPKGVRSMEQETLASEDLVAAASAAVESTPLSSQSTLTSASTATASPDSPVSIMAPINNENEFKVKAKDGDYFLREVERERRKIEALIEETGDKLNNVDSMGEESGKIRAAIGKARLLVNKKFKQFEGLCHTNLSQARFGVPADEPFPTKNEDLEGFWDMVLIQVAQIYSIFDELDPNKSKENTDQSQDEMKRIPFKKSGALNKTTTTKSTKALSTTSARDESRRKLLAEKRKAMKSLTQPDKNGSEDRRLVDSEDPMTAEVQIFIPSNEKFD